MPEQSSSKGSIIRLFGVVLIFLGVLDSLLSWRGGFALDGFYVLLIGAGLFLYAMGAVRRGSASQRLPAPSNASSDPGRRTV
jgi:hypothetical protein